MIDDADSMRPLPATGASRARKPSGYWKDVENVKKEIDAFNLAHGTPGVMPKEDHLKATGFGSLANAVHQHGAFKRFALEHGYQTLRKPNDYYKEFEVLRRELLDWVGLYGIPGIMPTAQQLKDAIPPRNDLVVAISNHDGPSKVAGKVSLRMSHDKKPDGFYDDIANLAREVYAFVEEHHLSGEMPNAGQLRRAGQSGLARAIDFHGGFWQVANCLGLTPDRKEKGYWTEETVDLEVSEYLKLAQIDGMMPTDSELREAGRADLAVAIPRHGSGMLAVAARLGLATRASKPDGYWDDEQTIARELLEFVRDHGTPGRMPTQAALAKAGRTDLTNAITRRAGGWKTVAQRLGLKLTEMPKDFWKDLENIKTAILALNVRRGRVGEMPTKTELDLAGEFSLGAAIEKPYGYPAVAAMFGLSAGRISLWPRSTEELILAHELMTFVHIDLEDHKVFAAGKRRDVDIIIRPLKLIIEFDSHYRHKENVEVDARKTEALQDGGWNVLRVREEPLHRIHPSDVLVRKRHYKEMCNRVLLCVQEMQGARLEGLDHYLLRRDLRNSAACALYIADILRTRRGEVVQE